MQEARMWPVSLCSWGSLQGWGSACAGCCGDPGQDPADSGAPVNGCHLL